MPSLNLFPYIFCFGFFPQQLTLSYTAFPSSSIDTLGTSDVVFVAESKQIAATYPHLPAPTMHAHHYLGAPTEDDSPSPWVGALEQDHSTIRVHTHTHTPQENLTGTYRLLYKKPGYLTKSQSEA